MLWVLQKAADYRGRSTSYRLEFGVDFRLAGGCREYDAMRRDKNAIVLRRVLPFVSVGELPPGIQRGRTFQVK
jgi:hypothetical protein